MAEIKVLKIGSDGLDTEHNSSSDQLTFSGYTADATNGFAVTNGVTVTDNIVFDDVADLIAGIENQNLLDKTAAETISGEFDFSSGEFTFPNAVSASPAEGDSYWDGTADKLYVYNGTSWQDVGASGSADSILVTYTAGAGGIAANDAVYISANDTVLKADASAKTTSKVIGFAPSAITAASSGSIQQAGVISGAISLATAGDPYFLDTTAGAISSSVPTGSGNVVIQVGYAKNADDLQIQIQSQRVRA